MSDLSSFLFASPSFAEGMGRIVDFGGTLSEFNVSPSPDLADLYALRSDWMATGNDVRAVMAESRDDAK